jgi:phosphate:Na+ symporter
MEAFRASFGAGAREAVMRFTRSKPQAMLFGAALAAATQDSTVSTSLALAFADVGMLTPVGSVVVMMGASVGGAFVTLLISLNAAAWSPLLFAVCFAMSKLSSSLKKVGDTLLPLSLILLGMMLLRNGVAFPGMRTALEGAADRPFAVFAVAFLITAVSQSTSALIALAVAAGSALPGSAVFPIVMASHLGGAVSALLASSGGRRSAKSLAAATLVYKLAGVAAFVPFAYAAGSLVSSFTLTGRIAAAQIVLVLFNAALFYPWPHILTRCGDFVSRFTASEGSIPAPRLDADLLEIPALAIRLLSKEMVRLMNEIEATLRIALTRPGSRPSKEHQLLMRLLPAAMGELAEACERYMYAIHPPSEPETMREYRAVSSAMLALREASRLAAGRLSALAGGARTPQFARAAAIFLSATRDAFHAFALGNSELARRAEAGKAKFDRAAFELRRALPAGSRRNSAAVDVISDMEALLRSALNVARADLFGAGGYTNEQIG